MDRTLFADDAHRTNRLRRGLRLLGIAMVCTATACGGGDSTGTPVAPSPPPPPPPPPAVEALTAVTLTPSTAAVVAGLTTSLTATPTTAGSGVSVTYSYASNAPAIATVSNTGDVLGVSAGSATITVTATGAGTGFTTSTRQATSAVTVTAALPALTALSVTPDSVALLTGASVALNASATTAGAGVRVQYAYASSANAIATVSSAGVITAVSPGAATITVTASGTGTGFAATELVSNARVLVAAPPLAVTAASVSPDSVELIVGGTATLTPSATTASAQVSVAYAYVSSATAVATVGSNGTITAISPGTATITVTASGSGNNVTPNTRQATAVVTVLPRPLPTWRRVASHPGESWAARWGDWTVAAGRLWVVENLRSSTASPVIHWSEDGVSWQSVAARTLGLPELPVGSDFYGGNTTLATGTNNEVVIATTLIAASSGAPSIDRTQPWVIRGTPGSWRVQGPPTTPGLNPLQIPNDGNFRFGMSTMTGAAASWGDRVVLLPRGIWWQPSATTDQSFLSLTSDASKDWQLFGKRGYPWGVNSFQWQTGAAGTPWGFFAVGHIAFETAVWFSPDGYQWNVIPDPVNAFGGSRRQSAMVWSGAMMYGQNALVMARVRDTPSAQMVAWSTRNGQQWTQSVIANETYGDVQGFATSSHYVVTVPNTSASSDRLLRHVWVSRDAIDWARIPQGPAFTKIIGLGGRLWGFRSGEVWELDMSGVGTN